MNTNEIIEMFDKYVIANYGRLPRVIVKGEGNYIFDADGNKILDMFPGRWQPQAQLGDGGSLRTDHPLPSAEAATRC